MFQYTYNNHFSFGYDNVNLYQDRLTNNSRFTARYGAASQLKLSWVEANRLAARTIYDQRSGNVVILYSGGLDSELCLNCFVEQKLPVKAVTLRFKDVDQSYENNFVHDFFKNRTIQHEYIDIAVHDFFKSAEFFKILNETRCLSPIIALQIWLTNQIDGTPIVAQGEVHLKKHIPADYVPGISPYENSPWYLVESERLCALYRNFIKQKKPGIPGFFQYLPEQIYSYVFNNPGIEDLIQNKVLGKLGTRTSKNKIIREYYPNLCEREKRHGLESIQELHDQIRKQQAQNYPFSDDSHRIYLEELRSLLVSG